MLWGGAPVWGCFQGYQQGEAHISGFPPTDLLSRPTASHLSHPSRRASRWMVWLAWLWVKWQCVSVEGIFVTLVYRETKRKPTMLGSPWFDTPTYPPTHPHTHTPTHPHTHTPTPAHPPHPTPHTPHPTPHTPYPTHHTPHTTHTHTHITHTHTRTPNCNAELTRNFPRDSGRMAVEMRATVLDTVLHPLARWKQHVCLGEVEILPEQLPHMVCSNPQLAQLK